MPRKWLGARRRRGRLDRDVLEQARLVMEHFQGKLFNGERVLFERVSGVFDDWAHRGERIGHLEVHEGNVPMLRSNRPYRLVLDDGRLEKICFTELLQSGTTGVTTLAFRVPGGVKVSDLQPPGEGSVRPYRISRAGIAFEQGQPDGRVRTKDRRESKRHRTRRPAP
jgi:hypothetical protein